jgi:hypothetical protein
LVIDGSVAALRRFGLRHVVLSYGHTALFCKGFALNSATE